jgi:hypothetical protein
MGQLNIQQQVSGAIGAVTEYLSASFSMPITHGTKTNVAVTDAYAIVAELVEAKSPMVVFLNNLGEEDAVYRITSGSVYHILDLPAGAFVVLHLSRSLAIGDGTGDKTVSVYSENGTTIEVGVFY